MEQNKCEVCNGEVGETIYSSGSNGLMCELCFNNLLSEDMAKEMIRIETQRTGDESYVDSIFVPAYLIQSISEDIQLTEKEQEEAVYLLVDKKTEWLELESKEQMTLISNQLTARLIVKALQESELIKEDNAFIDYQLVVEKSEDEDSMLIKGTSINVFYGQALEDKIMNGAGGLLQ